MRCAARSIIVILGAAAAGPAVCAAVGVAAAGGGCRSAVIVEPVDEATQTIVTVEHRPTTQPSDKGLIVREQ